MSACIRRPTWSRSSRSRVAALALANSAGSQAGDKAVAPELAALLDVEAELGGHLGEGLPPRDLLLGLGQALTRRLLLLLGEEGGAHLGLDLAERRHPRLDDVLHPD